MSRMSKVADFGLFAAPALFCGIAVAYFVGAWGMLIGATAFIAGYALLTRVPRRGILVILTDRPKLWTVLRLSFYYGGLILAHFGFIEVSKFGVAATICFLAVFTVFVIQRMIMPTFLAMPATDLFVPYFRIPERVISVGRPLRSGVVIFAVLLGRLAGLIMLFSVWTTFWWSRSVVQTTLVSAGPRAVLVAAEQTYSWSTLHAIPFVGIPEIFGWHQPGFFGDGAGPVIVLIFKVLVLLPMIATLVYFVRGVWEKRPETIDEDAPTPWARLTGRPGDGNRIYYLILWIGQIYFATLAGWYFFGVSFWWFVAGLTYLLLRVRKGATADATSDITFRRPPYSLTRLLYFLAGLVLAPFAYMQAEAAGSPAVVFVLAAVSWFTVMRLVAPLDLATPGGRVFVPYFRAPDRIQDGGKPLRSAPLVVLVLVGRLMALLTLFTVTTAFMTSQRWIHAPAGITSSSDILTKAAEGYAWQAANVIPVLEVPDTFGWHQPPGFTGTASGVLLLLFKLLVLLPVATSLVYLLRGLWEREPLLPERLEDGPPVPWTRTTGGWEDYLLLREIWKTQKRERHRRRRERLKQTASQLEGMSVDDVYKRGQVAIEAARARARLAGTARLLVSAREAKLWWTLDMFVARHEVFANVVEGDLRRRQARNRLVGHTVEGENVPETASDVTESKTRIVAAMLSVIRANAELSRGWPEVWQQLFEPEPA